MELIAESGEIITFYSYKGGTGRSMSLANVSCIIAKNYSAAKTPILMIDWDLDAPGLHRYFKDRIICENGASYSDDHPGLIDLFYEIETALSNGNFSERNYESLFRTVNFKKFVLKTNIPNLFLIKAGCFDKFYPDRVRTLDWVKLFNRYPWLFKCFSLYLSSLYKFVLIDSRTGITDIGGISTMLMPSKLVVVFTPNRQSIDGVIAQSKEAVNYRIQSDDSRPLVIFPLPSRIEASEPGLKDLWRNGSPENQILGYQSRFEILLSELYSIDHCDLKDYFENVQIQHVPCYSYGEKIAALDEPTKDRLSLTQSYEYFTWRLSSFDSPWELPKVPSQIPSPTFDFVGRNYEIKSILDYFNTGANIVCIRGMSGIGKTELALILASKLRDQFPDGQLIIDMSGTSLNPLSTIDALGQIIRAFSSEISLTENQNDLCRIYLSVLSRKRILLILDDAANKEQVMPLIPPAGCGLLITSRNKFTLPGMKAQDLGVLSQNEACEFLIKITDRIGDNVYDLVRICGCHPLAIRNVGSILAERIDIDVTKYVQRLKDNKPRLELVEDSIDKSYNLLASDQKEKWCLLSVFPSDFDILSAAAILYTESDCAAEVLSDLVKLSLIDFIPPISSKEGRYHFHDLVRIFADSRLSLDDRIVSQQRHANHYKNVLAIAEGLFLQGGENTIAGLDLFDLESINIKAGHAWAEQYIIKQPNGMKEIGSELALHLTCDYPLVGNQLLDSRLDPKEKIRWIESAIVAAQQLKDRGSECIHLNNLGRVYAKLGETHKAIESYKQALDISRLIGDPKRESDALQNLGNAYAKLGEINKVIDSFERALAIAHEIQDRDRESTILVDLGVAYFDLGEICKAIELYEQHLAIIRKTGDRIEECNTLYRIGQAYAALGENLKAFESHEQALKISRAIQYRKGEGINLRSLGLAYKNFGQIRKAIDFYEQALEISLEIGDRIEEANILNDLGSAYKNLGEIQDAIKHYEDAFDIFHKIGDRKGECDDLDSLANAYMELGNTFKAIESYKKLLVISREIGYRIGEGISLSNLGLIYEDLGETQRAIDYYEQRLDLAREIGDQVAEGDIQFRLGRSYADLGLNNSFPDPNKANMAIKFYEQSLQSAIANKIKDKNINGNVLLSIGRVYADSGDTHKAIEYYEQVLEIIRKMEYPIGEGGSQFIMSLVLDKLGQREDAINYAEKAFKILEENKNPFAIEIQRQLEEWRG